MDLGRYHADLPHPAQLIAVAPALQVATGPGFFVNVSAGRIVYVGAQHAPLPLRRVVWAGL